MKVLCLFLLVCIIAIASSEARRPPRPRKVTEKSPRPQKPVRNAKRVRTIFEATVDNLRNLKYRRNTNAIKKTVIKLPKITLKTSKRQRRPRPQKRPRPLRQAPPPPPQPQQSLPPTQVPLLVEETPYRTDPKTPAPPPIVLTPTSAPPTIIFNDPEPTQMFKFQLSDAKPSSDSLALPVAVSENAIAPEEGPEATPSDVYYKPVNEESDQGVLYGNAQVFPKDVANSLAEFASTSGSDDIGSLSPFSYFANPPPFVGSHVQYFQAEDPSQKSLASSADLQFNQAEAEQIASAFPNANSPLYSQDEIFYPVVASDEEVESNFYYIDEEEEEDPVDYEENNPVSFQSAGDEDGSSSSSLSFSAYPSYPPLAPAPPASSVEHKEGPILTYKSAFSSQDFSSSGAETVINEEPKTILTPDGTTFYFVGELENPQEGSAPPQDQYTPSPPYYKPLPTAPQLEEIEVVAAPTSPKSAEPLASSSPEPEVYFREETTEKSEAPLITQQPVKYPTTSTATTESSGAIYFQKRSTTPKSQDFFKEVDEFKFQKFEIPAQFREFLNTPPKWINMENW